ncbi:hypothetical protein DFJ77DRAFT_334838 [Powellomyces hirtus]|nr:hypothetical protein DFJ77DRAFT_334838 [Powellomyces hirtus]
MGKPLPVFPPSPSRRQRSLLHPSASLFRRAASRVPRLLQSGARRSRRRHIHQNASTQGATHDDHGDNSDTVSDSTFDSQPSSTAESESDEEFHWDPYANHEEEDSEDGELGRVIIDVLGAPSESGTQPEQPATTSSHTEPEPQQRPQMQTSLLPDIMRMLEPYRRNLAPALTTDQQRENNSDSQPETTRAPTSILGSGISGMAPEERGRFLAAFANGVLSNGNGVHSNGSSSSAPTGEASSTAGQDEPSVREFELPPYFVQVKESLEELADVFLDASQSLRDGAAALQGRTPAALRFMRETAASHEVDRFLLAMDRAVDACCEQCDVLTAFVQSVTPPS